MTDSSRVDPPSTGPAPTKLPEGVRLRAAEDADLPFLGRLYASTRTEEMQPVPWSDEEKAAFLQWQFEAQHAHYLEHYPDCERLVVELRGESVGRLYVDRWESEIRLVDIALLPEHRGAGIGGALLRRLLDEGREKDLPVSIHVEHNNPAMSLYLRLGFRHVDTNGVYHLMRWSPRLVEGGPEGG